MYHLYPYKTDTQRGRGNVAMEVKIGVIWPQVEEGLEPLATGRGREGIFLIVFGRIVTL